MSKFVDSFIDEVREATENEEFDDTIGLTEEEILRYMNDAQYRLHAKIIAQHPSVFTEVEELTIVADQEAYNIPFKAHLGNRITMIEYSSTGNANDYYLLSTRRFRGRDTGADGHPCSYIRKDGQILLYPTPTTVGGKLRVTYIRRPKELDKRRWEILTLTGTGGDSNMTLTAGETWKLTGTNGTAFMQSVNSSAVDGSQLQRNSAITIVDKNGVIKADNVPVEDVSAGQLTISSTYTVDSNDSVAVGNYILSGPFSTTHIEFSPEVERYIRAYTEWKILKRDSSIDSSEAMGELAEMEADIIASYADVDGDDLITIPDLQEESEYFNNWDMF